MKDSMAAANDDASHAGPAGFGVDEDSGIAADALVD